MDNAILSEEKAAAGDMPSPTFADMAEVKKALKEAKSRHEV